jgi:hypothetical protein
MSGTESHAVLLDDLAAPDPLTRSQVASAMRGMAEMFAWVPDGRHTARTLSGSPTYSTRVNG